MLLSEQKPTCGFIDMERVHTFLRCRRPIHAIRGFQVNRGEPVLSLFWCKMRYNKRPERETSSIHRGRTMMETKLAKISQLSKI